MRLLERGPNGGYYLTKDLIGSSIPAYAILSHTWGPDPEEVTFQDLMKGTGEDKAGYEKIRFCADQAQRHGLLYFWIDTCCINKENNTELAEAINSMFRWYHDAARCYVFLTDISGPSCKLSGPLPSQTWESAFRASRWFTRGWTLQELLAPKSVQFFAQDGTLLGDKISLQQQIHEITGIAIPALCGDSLAHFETEERFKWAETRQTTREEDWAYSLLGIFGVFISPIYGEGKENAVRRLKNEISEKLRSRGESSHQHVVFPRRDRQDGQGVSAVYSFVPYTKNPDFIGRSSILDQLKGQLGYGLSQADNRSQPRASLYGLGGVGKTQIALACVYWLQHTRPRDSVFWVHASSAERFRQAYLSIAKECSIPGHDDPKVDVLSLVKSWLECKGCGRWLMVIDNADDAQLFSHGESLGKWIPECAHGSVLITTRNKVVGSRLTRGKCLIEVGKIDETESRQLLEEKLEADDLNPDDLSRLTSRLEHLPLALVQAAAFIQEMSISVKEYLRLLEKSDQHLVDLLSEEFETVSRDPEAARAVAETWFLSFEQIQQQNAFARELLSLISIFDRQAIPKKFLSDYSKQQKVQKPEGEMQLVKALGVLKAFSFITEDKDHSFNMHRLVQLVTRKWLSKKDRMHQFAEQALLVVSHNYPYGDYENQAICSAYLPQAYTVLKFKGTGSRDERLARAALLHCAAGFFDYQGQWKEAERFLIQATEVRKELLGEEYPDTLISIDNLTLTYGYLGRWKEAEKLGVQVIEMGKRVWGKEHPDTLVSIGRLASAYQDQGQWKEAEELEVQVLKARKRVSGEEHPHTLSSMACLAVTYWNQGRLKEAEVIKVQVMETRKRVLGEEHPHTLSSMACLALTYRGQGWWKEAEELEVQVIETRKRVSGEEHPHTLNSMAGLASTYRGQGRWKEAEELKVQVMEMRKRVSGEEHPHTLNSMAGLASTYRGQGRWKEAEELEVQVMETRKRVLGEEHPNTLTSMGNLAFTWESQGRLNEALDLMRRCVEFQQQILGPDHPRTVSNRATLRGWEAASGRLHNETANM